MKSFNRIRALNKVVCDLIDSENLEGIVVADIATDHGYLSEQLSRNGKISKIIATDISQKCLDKTNELKKKFGLDKIETKLGDGLEPIDSAKIVVIAGVGGYEIIKMISNQNITKNGKKKCSIFVLQPSKNVVDVRLWLIKNDYKILLDKIVKSGGKFYPIIVVDLEKKCDTEPTIFNVYFGKNNSTENRDFYEFLLDTKTRFEFTQEQEFESDSSETIKTKKQIYNLASELIKKYKGENENVWQNFGVSKNWRGYH